MRHIKHLITLWPPKRVVRSAASGCSGEKRWDIACSGFFAGIQLKAEQSHEWQKLASVDDEKFEAAFAEGGKPSIAAITSCWEKEISSVSDDAQLCAFKGYCLCWIKK